MSSNKLAFRVAFIEKWILRIIILFVLIVLALIVFFLLLGPFGIAIAIGIIVVIIAYWEIIVAVIAVLLLIRLVVSIIYRIIKDLSDLWEWLTTPSPTSIEIGGG
jgi:hypothetical protein